MESKKTVLAVYTSTLARVNQMKGLLQVLRGESVTQDDTLNYLIDFWTQTQKGAQASVFPLQLPNTNISVSAN